MPVKDIRREKAQKAILPGVFSNWIRPFSYADLDEVLDGLECGNALEWRICLINREKIGTLLRRQTGPQTARGSLIFCGNLVQ